MYNSAIKITVTHCWDRL